jgi:hypothetical protein
LRRVDPDHLVALDGVQPGERAGAAADRVLEQLADVLRAAGDLEAVAGAQEKRR